MRVLLAEDQPDDRALLSAFLGQHGHETVICEDGLQAWEALQRHDAPRLLLLDWMMPGLDGPELCRRLRRQERQVYVIMVTAKNRTQHLVAGMEAGADDYVAKPFDAAELGARLRAGVRIIELWDRVLQAERLQALVQSAGAAAHEINQPLSVILASTQLLLRRDALPAPAQSRLRGIVENVERIKGVLERMRSVREYSTRDYAGLTRIADFGAGANDVPGSSGQDRDPEAQ